MSDTAKIPDWLDFLRKQGSLSPSVSGEWSAWLEEQSKGVRTFLRLRARATGWTWLRCADEYWDDLQKVLDLEAALAAGEAE